MGSKLGSLLILSEREFMTRKLKKRLIIFALACVIYLLAGFFLLPAVARHQIEKLVSKQLRGSLSIEEASFNPLLLTASFGKLVILDSENRKVFTLREIGADFTLWKLIRRQVRLESLHIKEGVLLDPLTQMPSESLPEVELKGLEYDWGENLLRLSSFSSANGETRLVLGPDGALNIPKIVEQGILLPTQPRAVPEPAVPVEPLRLNVESLTLAAHAFSFVNEYGASLGSWEFENINFEIKNFALAQGWRSILALSFAVKGGGQATVSGNFGVRPAAFNLQVQLDGIPLKSGEPLLRSAGLEFGGGVLNADLAFQLALQESLGFSVSGDLALINPTLLRKGFPEPIFAAGEVALRAAAVKAQPLIVQAEELSFLKPSVYYRTGGETAAKESQAEETAGESKTLPDVSLTSIKLQDGAFTLDSAVGVSPVVHRLTALTGELQGLSLGSEKPMQVDLRGKLAGEANVVLKGSVVPARIRTGINAALKIDRLPLRDFSPYTVKFLGREIAEGKLSADLEITSKGEVVRGSNNFKLHHLALGKTVPSKGALPIPIATVLALLRDRDGNITIDLPVEGRSTDPSFRYLNLVGKTLTDNLLKVAASPLTALGSLYDWQGGALEQILFDAASATLPVDETKKLEVLSRALLDKPALELEIRGGSSPAEFKDLLPPDQLAALASRRAQQIKEFLIVRGVSSGALFFSENVIDQALENGQVSSALKIISNN